MSVAIVAMVNHTAIGGESESSVDEECGVIADNTTVRGLGTLNFIVPPDTKSVVQNTFY